MIFHIYLLISNEKRERQKKMVCFLNYLNKKIIYSYSFDNLIKFLISKSKRANLEDQFHSVDLNDDG